MKTGLINVFIKANRAQEFNNGSCFNGIFFSVCNGEISK